MEKPLVYACSGCSNVARIAHDIALNLDCDGIASMSCVSGVVAGDKKITEQLNAAKQVIAIDGCNSQCTKSCLSLVNANIDHYFVITDIGIEKRDIWQDALLDNSKAVNHIYHALKAQGFVFN